MNGLFDCRFGKIFLLIPLLLLTSCALAPGMHYGDNTILTEGSSVIPITDINENLISIERKEVEKDEYQEWGEIFSNTYSEYKIGSNDILSIIVWDHPELVLPNLTYFLGDAAQQGAQAGLAQAGQAIPGYNVDRNGNIQFPYINSIHVAGLTEDEVKTSLQEKLTPYIKNPQITVRVVGYQSKKIFVDGQVKLPGTKAITNVPMTLAEALSQAGGLEDTGDPSAISVVRDGHKYEMSLPAMMRNGANPNEIYLRDKDVVRVSALVDHHVVVMGEVGKPGAMPFKYDGRLSLSDALAAAQGLNQSTSQATQIYVVRTYDDARKAVVFHLNGKSPSQFYLAGSFLLKDNDFIFVDAAPIVRWNRVFSQLLGGTTVAYYLDQLRTP
jgi:polysaccharide biosynthesis/export protein